MRILAKSLILGLALILMGLNSQVLLAETVSQDGSELKELSFQKQDNQLQVNIKFQGSFSFEIFELRQPNRLVIDFTPVTKISSQPSLEINDFGVLTVRAGQFQPSVARVVFDLDEKGPLHRISQAQDSLKVIFWQEGEPAPAKLKEETVPVKKEEPAAPKEKIKAPPLAKKETLTEAKETKPATSGPREARQETAAGFERERDFFVQLGGGIGAPLTSTTRFQKDLILYGETGSYGETYKQSSSPIFELGLGKYFKLGEKDLRLTLGVGYSRFKYTETLDLTIPHPFVANSPRTVGSSQELKNNLYLFYLSGAYPVVSGEKFSVWVGPLVGYASGKFTSIQDFSIEDNPPYTNADVKITSMTQVDETISSLLVGALVSLEYSIGSNVSISLDCRGLLFNPKVSNLNMNVKLSQVQFILGLKYDF